MKVFVSYRSTDRARVQSLVDDLKAMQLDVWFDQELLSSGGQKWWDNICEQIRNCDVFVFAMTSQSLQSYPCSLERRYAIALKRHVIPVRMTNDLGSLEMLPIDIQERQIVDYLEGSKTEFIALQNAVNSSQSEALLPQPLPL